MSTGDERVLWVREGVECVMISCCAGAELQVRTSSGAIVLRELYPTKSDLYERSQALELEYGAISTSARLP
jgi:hypothetical protein